MKTIDKKQSEAYKSERKKVDTLDYRTFIDTYSHSVRDFKANPNEMLNALQIRSTLKYHVKYMDDKELKMLQKADEYLLNNAEKVVNHVNGVYDFKQSKETKDEWWWHLDKKEKIKDL